MNRLDDNTQVSGFVQATQFLMSSGGTRMLPSAADHQHICELSWSGTAAAATQVIHVVRGATATLRSAGAGCVVANIGNATVTVDIKKNGTTVLTGTIGLSVSESAYDIVAGAISVTDSVAEDVFTAVVTVNAGTGTLGTGLFIVLVFDEAYA
jgi:hypothetical protein